MAWSCEKDEWQYAEKTHARKLAWSPEKRKIKEETDPRCWEGLKFNRCKEKFKSWDSRKHSKISQGCNGSQVNKYLKIINLSLYFQISRVGFIYIFLFLYEYHYHIVIIKISNYYRVNCWYVITTLMTFMLHCTKALTI